MLKIALWVKALDDAAALKDTCIHPTTNLPYIKSFKAGKDNSKEGIQVCSIVVPSMRSNFTGFPLFCPPEVPPSNLNPTSFRV